MMSGDEKTVLMPMLENVAIGTQLSGTYQLDERLASGGMGEVFLGHNIHTQDAVAIKIVLPEFARDAAILSLFRKEAKILRHLAHDAIVRYETFTIDQAIGRPYLVMEFMDGQSLVDRYAQGPMSGEDARKLLIRVASGLQAAHEAGIIHRDLSPDNIILPGGLVERAKIIDFGIARAATIGGETLIGGAFAGKYNFVSPEHLGMVGGEVAAQSDIYSLGLVLCASLLGKPLDMGGSQVDVIDTRRSVPDLSGIDAALRPLLEAMLQPEPTDRPESMAEIVRRASVAQATPIAEAALPPDEQSNEAMPLWDAPQPTPTDEVPKWQSDDAGKWPATDATAADPETAGTDPERTQLSVASWTVAQKAPSSLAAPLQPEPTGQWPAPEAGRTQPDIASTDPDRTQISVASWTVAQSPLPAAAPEALPPPVSPQAPPPAQKMSEWYATPSSAPAWARAMQAADPVAAAPIPAAPTPSWLRGVEEAADANMPWRVDGEPAATQRLSPQPATLAGDPPPPLSGSPAGVRGRGSPRLLAITGAAIAVVLLGIAGVYYSGLLGGSAQPPEKVAEPAPPVPDPAPQAPKPVAAEPKPVQPAPQQQAALPSANTGLKAVSSAADKMAWLDTYPGAPCFYAGATSVSGSSMNLQGFGQTEEPFRKLVADYAAKFGSEADMSVQLIRPNQCAVTDFLAGLRGASGNAPALSVADLKLADKQAVTGEVEFAPDRQIYLLLVDDDGNVHNLGRFLKQAGDRSTFSVPLALDEKGRAAPGGVPQLLLAISAGKTLATIEKGGAATASTLLPDVLKELQSQKTTGAATARYFVVQG